MQTGPEFTSTWEMVSRGSLSTQVIVGVLAVFSLVSWALIVLKLAQFRRLHREADQFMDRIEAAERVEEAYDWVRGMRESPFTRIFKRGVSFFGELRPGAMRQGTDVRGLSPAQLEVLRIVLEKEEGEERDGLSGGIQWLAIIATVAPLLGLLGTVLGVMHSFLGVVEAGSTNISAVAPGVAEALITTVAGLAVAIPAVIGYNYFVSRLNYFGGELEGFASEFIGTLAKEGLL